MPVPVPFLDLPAEYRRLKAEIDAAIQRVLDRGQFVLGPEGQALEQEIAAFCQAAHGVGVASGTDALELALRALEIGPGDEVITTAFSFIATAEAIVAVGATPVFADIDLDTYTLDPAAVHAAITPRTKALIPVHLYGHPCRMDELLAIARQRRLKVIEDCAQAFGAQITARRVGSFGDAGCLSFYPTKNLGGYGDGGMVVTRDAALAERLRLLRHHGDRGRYDHQLIGRNSRLDELQAAILRVKLRHVDAGNQARRRHAGQYAQLLTRAGVAELAHLPGELPGHHHIYHLYTLRLEQRARIQPALAEQGIVTAVHYPTTLPSQPALAPFITARPGGYPNAEAAARTCLSLPLYPELSTDQLSAVVDSLARLLRA
ncbi:MAG: DegT/DnrJ/EryC1/StrS family aminotransferase [Candidatus Omnitrophica bacterium]|nr:DegT/DnrJ/EryC1/StrS family aminotransferase [Candidatus Omnitrophota bacterium]